MIIIKLQGGLGNQMFQYATAKSLSLFTGQQLFLDVRFFEQTRHLSKDSFTHRDYELNIFPNINELFADEKYINKFSHRYGRIQRFLGFNPFNTFTEAGMVYSPALFDQRGSIYLDGYWQCEKYFQRYEEIIRHCFSFNEKEIKKGNIEIATRIKNEESVAVHIRRNDYMKPAINQVHGVCSSDYYLSAIEKMKCALSSPVFYFFSDDTDWVKDNFSHLPFRVFVENNGGKDSWQDMYLMTQCKHHIIANSSFSWWGAWLSVYDNKTVVAPGNWFRDKEKNKAAKSIIPEKWIVL